MELERFRNKICQLAVILKMTAQFPSNEDMQWHRWAYLIKDLQKIRISKGDYQNENKLHISGDFPKTIKGESGYYGKLISINVSDSKTPEQIAKDIEKRFLPIYLPELEKAVKQIERTNIYDQKRQTNIQKMADYFQIKSNDDDWKNRMKEPSIYVYNLIEGLGSRMDACGENKVKFELELTPEMAIKIFDLLKQE